jgi:hypothetical protein
MSASLLVTVMVILATAPDGWPSLPRSLRRLGLFA